MKQLRQNNPAATIKVEIVPDFTGIVKRPDRFDVKVSVTENGIIKPIDKPRYLIDNP